MTAATQDLEYTLLSSSLGQSVLDAIVQANINMSTVSQAAVESMMRSEQKRRCELGRMTSDNLCSV